MDNETKVNDALYHRCDYCEVPVPNGFEVRRRVERWRYDEYNSGACFQRIETDVICPRCAEEQQDEVAEDLAEQCDMFGCPIEETGRGLVRGSVEFNGEEYFIRS